MKVHALLTRQLKRYFREGVPDDPRVAAFISAVSEAYVAADEERRLLEHSLALSSTELEERNQRLLADIDERIRVESEANAFFRLSPDLLSIIGHDLKIKHLNPSWRRTLGYEDGDLLDREVLSLVHPDEQARVQSEAGRVTTDGSTLDFEVRFRAKDGTWRNLSWTVTSDATRGLYYAVARDVTRAKELQRELAQAQKLEAVGQLASGVAHEINTPMQFIGDNVRFAIDSFGDLVKLMNATREVVLAPGVPQEAKDRLLKLSRDLDLDYLVEEIPRALTESKDGVRRVAELVKALKEFAHPDTALLEAADVNQTITRALILSRGVTKHVARVEAQLGELPLLPCQPGLLGQVFLNLIVNAAHAIEDKWKKTGDTQPGLITVTSALVGDRVVVKVGDSGCGIPQAVRERIFEPFFTTKEVGRGSGQGLPLVRSVIVERHHGEVSFETEVGMGTTFIISLPLTRAHHGALHEEAEQQAA